MESDALALLSPRSMATASSNSCVYLTSVSSDVPFDVRRGVVNSRRFPKTVALGDRRVLYWCAGVQAESACVVDVRGLGGAALPPDCFRHKARALLSKLSRSQLGPRRLTAPTPPIPSMKRSTTFSKFTLSAEARPSNPSFSPRATRSSVKHESSFFQSRFAQSLGPLEAGAVRSVERRIEGPQGVLTL